MHDLHLEVVCCDLAVYPSAILPERHTLLGTDCPALKK